MKRTTPVTPDIDILVDFDAVVGDDDGVLMWITLPATQAWNDELYPGGWMWIEDEDGRHRFVVVGWSKEHRRIYLVPWTTKEN